MAASISELQTVVSDSLNRAESAADAMRLDEKLAKAMVKDLPRFRSFTRGSGASAWAAVLFVDLRRSTERAKSIGHRKTYFTMHALLPALAFAVEAYDGYVVGFRGDGLFAVFGLGPSGFNEQGYSQSGSVTKACCCGQWMIEGIAKVVNPALEARACMGNLRIGVGVDSGTIIVTRIGFREADEVTAYGDAVNSASKISSVSNNNVIVSAEVDRLYPTSDKGTVKAKPVPGHPEYKHMEFRNPLLKD